MFLLRHPLLSLFMIVYSRVKIFHWVDKDWPCSGGGDIKKLGDSIRLESRPSPCSCNSRITVLFESKSSELWVDRK